MSGQVRVNHVADYIRPWESHPTGDTRGTRHKADAVEKPPTSPGASVSPSLKGRGQSSSSLGGFPLGGPRQPLPAVSGHQATALLVRGKLGLLCAGPTGTRGHAPRATPPPPRAPGWEERTRQPTRRACFPFIKPHSGRGQQPRCQADLPVAPTPALLVT